ncbi:hypothetical protein [Sorangium sp. So ce131]|uniref:hypothetical protein n=1 Tax=Sorangium sp. So ce131 TaxID=3133282 RepID=UPI003F5E7C7E
MPPTIVPFFEPRSSTQTCPSERVKRACSRDIVGSSMQRSAGGARPTTIGVSGERTNTTAFSRWLATRATWSCVRLCQAESTRPEPVTVLASTLDDARPGSM